MDNSESPNRFPIVKVRKIYRLAQYFIFLHFKILFGLRIEGRENVPARGHFILASNHSSWFDPPIIGSCCPREIAYAAKKELFEMFLLGSIVKFFNSIPVSRSGFDRTALVKLGETLDSGNGIIMFPEGTRFSDDKLHPPKAGVGMLAIRHRVPVVPVYINSDRFRASLFRRNLRVRFGKVFTIDDLGLTEESRKDGYRKMSLEVMRRIADIGNAEFVENLKNALEGEKVI